MLNGLLCLILNGYAFRMSGTNFYDGEKMARVCEIGQRLYIHTVLQQVCLVSGLAESGKFLSFLSVSVSYIPMIALVKLFL